MSTEIHKGEFVILNLRNIKPPSKRNIPEFEKQLFDLIDKAERYLEIRLQIDFEYEEIWGDIINDFEEKWKRRESDRKQEDVFEINYA